MNNLSLAIAVSGGLDSTISIILLKKLNFKLSGFFFVNWKKNIKKLINILNISNILNFKIKLLNYNKFYIKNVFNKLIKYKIINVNINSDSKCNKLFKFNIIIKYIKSLNFKKLATGHYSFIKKYKLNKLKLSKDYYKDQSYFLNSINLKLIKFLFYPLGNLTKKNIIFFIKKIKNFFYKEKESKGICFIENKNFKILINNFNKKKIDYIVNYDKIILGLHIGNFFYTIGQKKNNMYIFSKKKNFLYTENFKKTFLFLTKIILIKLNLNGLNFKFYKFYLLKLRHSNNFFLCKINFLKKNNLTILLLDKFVLNCCIGQNIAIYKNKNFLCGGTILKCI